MPVGGEPLHRRHFVAMLGGIVGLSQFSTQPLQAQSADNVRRIGVLMARHEDDPEAQKQYAGLKDELHKLGWINGTTIQIETRWIVGDAAKSLAAARELIALKSDLLVANATPSVIAMRQATSTVPIVFVSIADPVGQRFVPSLARPDGNITGFSAEEASMGGKWLEVLKEAAPRVARVVVVYNPDTAPYAPMFLPTLKAAADRTKVTLRIAPVQDANGMERVIATTATDADSALMVLPDSYMFGQRERLVALAARHKMPAIFPIANFVSIGGLLAYGIDRVDLFRRTATYVDRILKGAKPAELPVQQPLKFELAINLKTARALGLTVPQSLLLSADEVIE